MDEVVNDNRDDGAEDRPAGGSTTVHCAECGAELLSGTRKGSCPRCLIELAGGHEGRVSGRPPSNPEVGGHPRGRADGRQFVRPAAVRTRPVRRSWIARTGLGGC